jgi:hypothetical protein
MISNLYGDGGCEDEVAAAQVSRDAAAVNGAVMRAGSATRAGLGENDRRDTWGGGLRRNMDGEARVYREIEQSGRPVAGRAVPVGFARYVAPVINLGDYTFRRVAAWRVAVPRALSSNQSWDLLSTIWKYGPSAAGYVRIGSTMVPATLEPGERIALSTAADSGVGGSLGYNSSGLSDFRDV